MTYLSRQLSDQEDGASKAPLPGVFAMMVFILRTIPVLHLFH